MGCSDGQRGFASIESSWPHPFANFGSEIDRLTTSVKS
jgi:hypothetical protein